jgi:hypothetical protein
MFIKLSKTNGQFIHHYTSIKQYPSPPTVDHLPISGVIKQMLYNELFSLWHLNHFPKEASKFLLLKIFAKAINL